MIIQRAHLRNFCCIEDREFTFHPRMNLIVGQNGSGKSSLLRALIAAITGDFGSDTKAADIREHSGDEPAGVDLWMEHGPSQIHVHRGLRPNNHSLEIDGRNDDAWRTATGVNAEILTRLGCTKPQLMDYVFVAQQKLLGLLDKTASERGAELQTLFGLSEASKIHKLLGEFLSGQYVPTPATDLEVLRGDLATKLTERDTLQHQLDSEFAAVPQDLVTFVNEKNAIINAEQQRTQLVRQVAITTADVERDRQELLRLQSEQTQNQADLDVLNAAIAEGRETYDIRKREVGAWANWRQFEPVRQQIATREQELETYRQQIPPLDKEPEGYVEVDDPDFSADYTRLHKALEAAEHLCTQLSEAAAGDKCPVCLQPTEDIAARATEAALAVGPAREAFEPYERRWQQSNAYRAALALQQQYQQGLELRESHLFQSRQALTEVGKPRCDEAASQQAVTEYEELMTAAASTQTAMNTLQPTLAQAQRTLDNGLQRLQDMEGQLAELVDQSAAAATAQAEINEARTQHAAMTTVTNAYNRVTLDAQHLETAIQDHLRVVAQGQAVQASLERLREVRQLYHRDEAPRIVSFTYLEQLEQSINETLTCFDAPFRVTPDDSLSFHAEFLDGSASQPASRLSVGQRVVLAISFRVAVNAMFAGTLGMLSLDEPTAGLDEQRLDCLPTALERLRELSTARGLQVLFVTHEPRIGHLFDNVIQL